MGIAQQQSRSVGEVAQGAGGPNAVSFASELKAALETAPEWMRAPITLAAFTGMRRGELLGIRWTEVDAAGRRIYLRDTKNRSLRIVPLNELSFRVLASLPKRRAKRYGAGWRGWTEAQRLHEEALSETRDRRCFLPFVETYSGVLVGDEGRRPLRVGQLLGHRTP